MKFIILALFCVALSMATSDDINKHWEEFKKHHKKSYSSHEEPLRKELFAKHKALVNLHNKKHAKGEVPYYIGINQFSDMTESEKEQSFGGRPPNQNPPSFHVRHKRFINESVMWQYNLTDPIFHPFYADDNFTFPASVDLRTTGWSEPVRNQGGCGSCYAFAASTAMSHYQFKKTNQSLLFSPQNLIDCADIWGAGKCKGSWPYMVLEYMMIQKQTLEDYYPYLRYSKSCTVPGTAPRYGIDGFVYVNPDMNSLKQAVAQLGAVIISFDATYLFHYAGGIWDGSDPNSSAVCANNKLIHAVALIGYGTDAATNTSYWLLQNSWGSSWGENGYFRMKMNSTDLCGMLSFNFLPA